MTPTQPTAPRLSTVLQPYRRWLQALFVFGVALALLWGTALWADHDQSPEMAYFNHLADSFSAGRLVVWPVKLNVGNLSRAG
jgi:hypothetical protein